MKSCFTGVIAIFAIYLAPSIVAAQDVERTNALAIAEAEIACFANATKFALNRAISHKRKQWRRFDTSWTPPLLAEIGEHNKDLGESTSFKYLISLIDAYRRKTFMEGSEELGYLRAKQIDVTANEVFRLIEKGHSVLDSFDFPLYENLKSDEMPIYTTNMIELVEKVGKIESSSNFRRRFEDFNTCRKEAKIRFNSRLKPEQRRVFRSTQLARAFERVDRALGILKSISPDSVPVEVKDIWSDLLVQYPKFHTEILEIVIAPFEQALEGLEESDVEGKLAVIEAAGVLSPRLISFIVARSGKKLKLADKSNPVRTARLNRLRCMIHSCQSSPGLRFLKGELEFDLKVTLPKRPRELNLSPDGARIVTVNDGQIEVYDLVAGKKLFEIDHESQMTRVRRLPWGQDAVFWGGQYQLASIAATTAVALTDKQGSYAGQIKVDPPKPYNLLAVPTGELMIELPNGFGIFDAEGELIEHVDVSGGVDARMFSDGSIAYRANRTNYFKKIGGMPSQVFGIVSYPRSRLNNQIFNRINFIKAQFLFPVNSIYQTITFPVECNGLLSTDDSSQLFLNPSQNRMCQTIGGQREILISDLPSLKEVAYIRTKAYSHPIWIDDDRLIVFGGDDLVFVDLNHGTVQEFEMDFRFHDIYACSPNHRHIAFVVSHEGKISVARLSLDRLTRFD